MTGLIDSIYIYLCRKVNPNPNLKTKNGGSNEPLAEVRSKVEAHLMRPDNRKTNEAQKATLETPRYRLSGSWNLHISSGQQH